MRRLLLILCTAMAATGLMPATAGAGTPLTATPVVSGLAFPSSFTFASDGRIFWTEKTTGKIGVFTPGSPNSTFATIPSLCTSGEQGLLGIALDPGGTDVYVYASRDLGAGCRLQVLRVAPGGGGSPTIIFDEPGSTSTHVGGRLALGPDGNLWLSIGDGQNPANSQNTASQRGKLLRMTTAGAAAPGNPIAGNRMYAYGLRNSFGFTFDAANSDTPWMSENGPECNDEVDRIVAGDNYGWGPNQTCSGSGPTNTNQDGPNIHLPELWNAVTDGPTGAAFCAGCGLAGLEGQLLWAGVNDGVIRALTLNSGRTKITTQAVAYDHTGGVLALETAPDKAVYFSDSGAIYRLGGATAGTPALSVDDRSAAEGTASTTTLTFTVSLDHTSGLPVTVRYATKRGTANSKDYTTAKGTLTIPAGASSATVPVTIKRDSKPEPTETFTLVLSRPRNASVADGTGVGTIVNDD